MLFLFLMTIPVQLLFVFMFGHLLAPFLDHAPHNFFSFDDPSCFCCHCEPIGRGSLVFQIASSSQNLGTPRNDNLIGFFSVHNYIGLGPQHTSKPLNFGDDVVAKDIDIRSFHQCDYVIGACG